ncbi:MAG: hypothetical protein HC822_01720 [Oscillochloris sp.]|nr:hypothetical protein [Oscillochloris sp.]
MNYFAQLTEQPPNRWEGFDLGDPGSRTTSLRDQLTFTGLALVILACAPEADAAERERGLAGLTAISARLGQRRIWADAALVAERAGLLPDPISEGNAGFAGQLAAIYSLRALLGIAPPEDEPVELRWLSDFCFRYPPADLTATLVRRMREWPDGGVPSYGTVALPYEMLHVLWALHLSDRAFGGDHAGAGDRWLSALEERIALRGPRMFGRGVFAGTYDLKRRAPHSAAIRSTTPGAWRCWRRWHRT